MATLKRFGRPAASLIVVLGLLVGMNAAGGNDVYSVIATYIPDFGNILKEVNRRYVDEVDAEKLLKNGIDGMLSTLDPYTTYIEKEDKKQLEIMTEGKYHGVGLPINFRNNIVTVADPPFLDTPSFRAGIREGDQIVKVDGVETKGLGLNATVQKIRGPAGTEVTITVHREGVENLLDFTLVREKITVGNIRFADYIGDGIGYIQLTRFSKNAGREVADAIREMQSKSELKGLILDLRSNPGGMLEAAVEISDLFLPKKAMIVSTLGRDKRSDQEFKSFRDPVYGDGPMVVLVNGISASASEIVAGAIQDHDRGIIVGDTTFGKGLVQTVLPLSKTSALKITTAKYYTPSGRCIQKRNYSQWADSTALDTSTSYMTTAGRPVHGGGGIVPDVAISRNRASDLAWDMRRKSLYFNFAVHYANTHEKLSDNFEINEAILIEFKKYIKTKEYDFVHPIEGQLSTFKSEAIQNGYNGNLVAEIERLETAIKKSKEDMFESSSADIKRILKQELATKMLGIKRAVEIGIQEDDGVQKAISVLTDTNHYKNVLIAHK